MSKEFATLLHTGSRDIPIYINSYCGGEQAGTCIQLTAIEEDGTYGYIQLSSKDVEKLIFSLQEISWYFKDSAEYCLEDFSGEIL